MRHKKGNYFLEKKGNVAPKPHTTLSCLNKYFTIPSDLKSTKLI